MALKDLFLKHGMKLISDPRVAKLMQDERVMKTLMQAIQLRGKVQESFDQRVERIAKALNLATQKELRELKRTLRKVERDLDDKKGGAKKA